MSVRSKLTARAEPEGSGDTGLRQPAASPADDGKTRTELLEDVAHLRQRLTTLESLEVDRRTIEAELKGTRQRLQYLLAVSPAIIYTTKATSDYACTFVSENLRDIMGYTPQEMTTDPKCWPDHLHPDDAPRVLEEIAPLIEQGGGTTEYRFRRRDGEYIWIQDTFKVVRDGSGKPSEFVGAWADITQAKKAERTALEANAELQETKRYLTRLIASSPDAIIATDKQGKVALFNDVPKLCLDIAPVKSSASDRRISTRAKMQSTRSC